MKKTMKKIVALGSGAALLVTASVMGTMAWLQDTDAVTNTFTVGKVAITLDEADVDNSQTNVTTEGRDKANTYKLVPGHTYAKDPTVHVEAGSENSWIFVKVENGIESIESAENKIKTQILENWTALEGVDNVYYQEWTTGADGDLVVFESFKIDDGVLAETINTYADANIVVTAYAVQRDDVVDTAAKAWDIVK